MTAVLRRPGAAGSELDRLRAAYGRAARLWVRGDPPVSAFTIALCWFAASMNSLLVFDPDPGALSGALQVVTGAGFPAMLLVSGPALGNVQLLPDARWVCIGQRPFMRRDREPADGLLEAPLHEDEFAYELHGAREMAEADRLLGEVFGPDATPLGGMGAGLDVQPRTWALRSAGSMVSCATTVQVDDVVTVWNVATHPAARRRGYGARLLNAVHRECERSGEVGAFLLSSTPDGYRLYESLGYKTIECWQMWSRPRWALGSA